MLETIWYKDPIDFLKPSNLPKFIPTSSMSFVGKLNATMRFVVYFTVVVYLLREDTRALYIAIFAALLIAFMYEMYERNRTMNKEAYERLGWGYDKLNKRACTMPSRNNPMANILVSDYSDNAQRPPGCDINDKNIKKMAETYFEENLYRDVDDVWNRKTSSRNYYQTPIQTIPNDQRGFAEWLYKSGPTCKEGNGLSCHKNMYNDLRI